MLNAILKYYFLEYKTECYCKSKLDKELCSYVRTMAENTLILLLQFQKTGESWMSEGTGNMPRPKLE